MKKQVLFLFFPFLFLFSCDREIENPIPTNSFDFFPLLIGNYWTYEVEERIYFGENDFEDDSFFYRDQIRTVYVNDAGEQVFIVRRDKSENNEIWELEVEYTLVIRENNLIMNLQNQPLIVLVYPIKEGVIWNGNKYRDASLDEFELKIENPSSSGNSTVRVIQEDADDLITFRDIRYDVFEENVGLTERYYEVLTYCSRNDCLGDQLIDSGRVTYMKLIEFGDV
ncbi:hypothetical protein E4S40_04240 [Algoriphagus kandeliae]|uniref:Uncharacterized protein n=1 Tax=Algoriphagus kandeliae TaxID=2562278 RepID=A0A4Y9R102_9BACT|nr:hypothetical protein [Algoriphagus kandeliae]TFV97858.1 hypothetical protein E4S40_04240 [Algoriphagus kandeliae]